MKMQKDFTIKQNIDVGCFLKKDSAKNIVIEDFACGKNVLELCNHPEQLTREVFDGYDGKSGYCGVHTPSYLTIDLGKNCSIGLIQMMLMDLMDDKNHGEKDRLYHYRILAAGDYTLDGTDRDKVLWSVLYDSGSCGYRNWQFIRIVPEINVRFIRVHCVCNHKNSGFHLVRLRAFSPEVADAVDYDRIKKALSDSSICLENGTEIAPDIEGLSQIIEVDANRVVVEMGDGFPLSKRIYDMTNLIKQIVDGKDNGKDFLQFNFNDGILKSINSVIAEELEAYRVAENSHKINLKLDKIYTILMSMAADIAIVEKNGRGMQRVILEPVNFTLNKSNKQDIFWTIVSIVFMIIPWLILGFINRVA
ncbi:MAG: discoidin domain-containing protein [Alistipes sp.]|nr:discoidin domain-containing protein [Alistipes sp.]